MKFLLLLLVLLFGVWLWRSSRSGGKAQGKKTPAPPSSQPQDMVRCALCDIHVPQTDAVEGKLGTYCCNDHRQRAEP